MKCAARRCLCPGFELTEIYGFPQFAASRGRCSRFVGRISVAHFQSKSKDLRNVPYSSCRAEITDNIRRYITKQANEILIIQLSNNKHLFIHIRIKTTCRETKTMSRSPGSPVANYEKPNHLLLNIKSAISKTLAENTQENRSLQSANNYSLKQCPATEITDFSRRYPVIPKGIHP